MPRRQRPPDPQTLLAAIAHFEPSYFISENRGHRHPVSDEALLEIAGEIVRISPKLEGHLGEAITITLACSQAFPADENVAVRDSPSLMGVNLSKRERSMMAYLPAAAFWSLAGLIEKAHITHIEATFAPIRYGSGDLQSLYFASPSKALELLGKVAPAA